MTFDREKWRAELRERIRDSFGQNITRDTEHRLEDMLSVVERAYAEGRADANSALEEIHIMAAADGPAEFLATQRRHIGQLAIDTLAAARGTP